MLMLMYIPPKMLMLVHIPPKMLMLVHIPPKVDSALIFLVSVLKGVVRDSMANTFGDVAILLAVPTTAKYDNNVNTIVYSFSKFKVTNFIPSILFPYPSDVWVCVCYI